ncbi:hypothetical protein [Oceanithermus sp.]
MTYKPFLATLVAIAFSLLLYGCAPGAITPEPSYGGQSLATGAYPPTTRAGHFNQEGFYITSDPRGLGLEVALGHWRGSLFGGYWGVNLRNSWSQDEFGVSLDTAYNAFLRDEYVDTDGDGIEEYVTSYVEMVGAALDGTYYFAIPTELGSAYAGPRLRAYFACESVDQAGYSCSKYGLLPGAALGINVPLEFISERLTFGLEGSVLLVLPGITDEPRFTLFSPFAFSLSYRF